MKAAVEIFYEKNVLKQPKLAPMFATTDMRQQKGHQTKFLTYAFGGPGEYSDDYMRRTHTTVNNGKFPTQEHFDLLRICLRNTLEELVVPKKEIDEALAIFETTHDAVLGTFFLSFFYHRN